MNDRIDIEAALHWAFGVVGVERLAREVSLYGRDAMAVLAEIGPPRGPMMKSASDLLASVLSLGVIVQAGGGGSPRPSICARFAASLDLGRNVGRDDIDALEILDAVTDLPAIWLEVTRDGVVLWDCESAERIGASIVCTGGSWLRRGDDWTVIEDAGVLALVVGNARLGTSVHGDLVAVEPEVRRRRGPPTSAEVAEREAQWRRLETSRARYAAWWASLEWLVGRLSGRLSTMEVTGPAIPREPWAVTGRPRLIEGISR